MVMDVSRLESLKTSTLDNLSPNLDRAVALVSLNLILNIICYHTLIEINKTWSLSFIQPCKRLVGQIHDSI